MQTQFGKERAHSGIGVRREYPNTRNSLKNPDQTPSKSNPMKTFLKILALFAALVTVGSSQAALLVYDSFQGYTTGNLIGQTTAATGVTGNWLDAAPNANVAYTVAIASTMSYSGGDVVVNGGTQYGLVTAGPAAGPALAAANLALGSGLTVGTGAKYISFLMRFNGALDASDQFTFHMANTNSTTSTLRSGVRESTGDQAFVANDSSSSVIATPLLTANTTYFAVLKLESTGINWSQATMWLNPTSTTVEGGGAAGSAVRALSGNAAMNYLGFKFQNADISDSFALDEIRIGTTWSDVVTIPEPSTWVMLVGGCTALVFLRRRRNF